MPGTLDDSIISSVANDNLKTVGGQVAVLSNLSLQNLIAHQNRMYLIAEGAVGNIVKRMTELDPAEAAAMLKATQSDLAAQIGSLGAAIAEVQQLMKGAQTTRPETGSGSP